MSEANMLERQVIKNCCNCEIKKKYYAEKMEGIIEMLEQDPWLLHESTLELLWNRLRDAITR